jgi:colanic acid/amylovoran biosynthesis glycosyltransferase
MLENEDTITVLHSVGSWLEQTQTWIHTQVSNLPRSVRTHIVCNNTQNLDQFYAPNIHSLAQEPLWRNVWDRGLQKLGLRHHLGFVKAIARTTSSEILHSHFGPTGWSNIEVARQLGLKHVVTFYGFDVNYVPRSSARWRERYAELFDHIDLVLCEGPHMAGCIEKLGCAHAKIQVHHLGVPLDRLPFRPRLWSRGEPLRVLIAASFKEKKGIPYALESLGRVHDRVNIEITLIGGTSGRSQGDLAERDKILDVIARYRLSDKIRMLGFQPHAVLLEEAYRNHIYLSPSVTATTGDTEGGAPVSIIELAATGMPVISTFHCDIPEVIEHGVTGLLAGERDIDGLVSHLEWLIHHPDQWLTMVSRARERMERQFAAQAQGLRLGEIYRRLGKVVGVPA